MKTTTCGLLLMKLPCMPLSTNTLTPSLTKWSTITLQDILAINIL